jgi:glutamyl-tRNA synthetase
MMPDGTVKKGIAEKLPSQEEGKVVQFERFGFARIETVAPMIRAYFTQN